MKITDRPVVGNILVEGEAILFKVSAHVTGLLCQRFVVVGPLLDILDPLSVPVIWAVFTSLLKVPCFV